MGSAELRGWASVSGGPGGPGPNPGDLESHGQLPRSALQASLSFCIRTMGQPSHSRMCRAGLSSVLTGIKGAHGEGSCA